MAKVSEAFVEIRAKTDRLKRDLNKAVIDTRDAGRKMSESLNVEAQVSRTRTLAGIGTRIAGIAAGATALGAAAASGLRLATVFETLIDKIQAVNRALIGTTPEVNVTAERIRLFTEAFRSLGGPRAGIFGQAPGSAFDQFRQRILLPFLPSELIRSFAEGQRGTGPEVRKKALEGPARAIEDFARSITQQLELLLSSSEVERIKTLFRQSRDALFEQIEQMRFGLVDTERAFELANKALRLLELQFAPLLTEAQELDRGVQRGIVSTIQTATGAFRVGQQRALAQAQLNEQQQTKKAIQELRRVNQEELRRVQQEIRNIGEGQSDAFTP